MELERDTLLKILLNDIKGGNKLNLHKDLRYYNDRVKHYIERASRRRRDLVDARSRFMSHLNVDSYFSGDKFTKRTGDIP